MKINKQKIVAFSMAAFLMVETASPAFADSDNFKESFNNVSIESNLNDNQILVDNHKITTRDTIDGTVVEVLDLDNYSKEQFVYSESSETIHSSYTNQYIDLNDYDNIESNTLSSVKDRSVSNYALINSPNITYKTKYQTSYYSYKQIQSMVGKGATVASVVAALIALGSTGGLAIIPASAADFSKILGQVSTILNAINIVNARSDKGIWIKRKYTFTYASGRLVPQATEGMIVGVGFY